MLRSDWIALLALVMLGSVCGAGFFGLLYLAQHEENPRQDR